MSTGVLCWFVFGHPPGQNVIKLINGVDGNVKTEEEAIQEGINGIGDFSSWTLAAIPLNSERGVDLLQSDLQAAMKKLGAPEEVIDRLVHDFARKTLDLFLASSVKKHFQN